MLRPLLANLVASDLVERLHQVTHDVEFVEHQYRVGRAVFDDFDVGLPHVAANAFNGSRFLRPQELEERLQRRLRTPLATPQQALVLEVIDVGHVDMTALSRDLVDADVGHAFEVTMREPVGHRLIDRSGHCAPSAMEQPRHLLPGQHSRPRRQRHHQGSRHALFAAHPRHRLDTHTGAPRTTHPPRRVSKRHRDPPYRHVPEVSDSTRVAVPGRLVAPATARRIAPVGAKRRHQSVDVSGDVHHSKPLQFDRCLDQTPNEHEFPLGYLGGVETPKYLMELMLFNSQSRSTCTDFCEEPVSFSGPTWIIFTSPRKFPSGCKPAIP